MERSNNKNVGPAQAVVAVNNCRNNGPTIVFWGCSGQAQYRYPEIKMLVVFPDYDLRLVPTVDFEYSHSIGVAVRGECR